LARARLPKKWPDIGLAGAEIWYKPKYNDETIRLIDQNVII